MEADEQIALIQWTQYMLGKYPELGLLHAIPNEGAWRNARLLAMGVRPGMPDLNLPISRGGYHGLWIEMKWGDNKPTPVQYWCHEALRAEGHMVVVCYSFEEAKKAILDYLEMP